MYEEDGITVEWIIQWSTSDPISVYSVPPFPPTTKSIVLICVCLCVCACARMCFVCVCVCKTRLSTTTTWVLSHVGGATIPWNSVHTK